MSMFDVILADPPWRYEQAGIRQEIEKHYPTMSIDEIKAMQIEKVAAKNSVLFLWATAPKLAEAVEVMTAWGFLYRTCMVWHKSGMGMGWYWRIDHELLLLGVRGKPGTPPPKFRPRSVLKSKKGKHSQKPWQVYEMIEAMYPNARRLELFCRHSQPGWSSWGNEATENLFSGPILCLDAIDRRSES